MASSSTLSRRLTAGWVSRNCLAAAVAEPVLRMTRKHSRLLIFKGKADMAGLLGGFVWR